MKAFAQINEMYHEITENGIKCIFKVTFIKILKGKDQKCGRMGVYTKKENTGTKV